MMMMVFKRGGLGRWKDLIFMSWWWFVLWIEVRWHVKGCMDVFPFFLYSYFFLFFPLLYFKSSLKWKNMRWLLIWMDEWMNGS